MRLAPALAAEAMGINNKRKYLTTKIAEREDKLNKIISPNCITRYYADYQLLCPSTQSCLSPLTDAPHSLIGIFPHLVRENPFSCLFFCSIFAM